MNETKTILDDILNIKPITDDKIVSLIKKTFDMETQLNASFVGDLDGADMHDCELGNEIRLVKKDFQNLSHSDIDCVADYYTTKEKLRKEAQEAFEQYQYFISDCEKIVDKNYCFIEMSENKVDDALRELREYYNK